MSITVNNLDQAEAWNAGGILGPGKHHVRIAAAGESVTANGNPQIELRFEATEPDKVGQHIRDWIVVTPKTYGKVRQFLEACGIAIQQGEWELPIGQLVGRTLSIYVQEEAREGGAPGEKVSRVIGYIRDAAPAGQAPAASFTPKSQPDIPFARPRVRDHETRRRDLFTGDKWLA